MNAIPNLIPGAPTTLGSRFPGQIRRYSGVKLIATQSKQESDLGWPRCVCVWIMTMDTNLVNWVFFRLACFDQSHLALDETFNWGAHGLGLFGQILLVGRLVGGLKHANILCSTRRGKEIRTDDHFFRAVPTVPTTGKASHSFVDFAGPKNRPGPKFVNCLHYRIVDVSTVKAGPWTPWSWCGLIRSSPMVFFCKFQWYV
jgi:hypothetical protein